MADASPSGVRSPPETFTTLHSFFAWDHRRLEEQLARACECLDDGDDTNAQRGVAHYVRGMRRHMHLEDEVLVLQYGNERTGAAKLTISGEHEQIGQLLDELERTLAANDPIAFRGALARLRLILPAHCEKEETQVYPLLDALVGPEESARLVARLRAE